jgi:hypothetical protein
MLDTIEKKIQILPTQKTWLKWSRFLWTNDKKQQ